MQTGLRFNRRWIGGVCLVLAIGLLIAGETLFEGWLGPFGFVLLWTVCFVLTAAAIVIAFADARATTARTVREQRELFDSTLKKIQDEAAHRERRRRGNGA